MVMLTLFHQTTIGTNIKVRLVRILKSSHEHYQGEKCTYFHVYMVVTCMIEPILSFESLILILLYTKVTYASATGTIAKP